MSLFVAVTTPLYARNIRLILPIAAALEAVDFESRPIGTVNFFFGEQKSPEILAKLGSYAATPRSAAMGRSCGLWSPWKTARSEWVPTPSLTLSAFTRKMRSRV
jgi:hypothetical protein